MLLMLHRRVVLQLRPNEEHGAGPERQQEAVVSRRVYFLGEDVRKEERHHHVRHRGDADNDRPHGRGLLDVVWAVKLAPPTEGGDAAYEDHQVRLQRRVSVAVLAPHKVVAGDRQCHHVHHSDHEFLVEVLHHARVYEVIEAVPGCAEAPHADGPPVGLRRDDVRQQLVHSRHLVRLLVCPEDDGHRHGETVGEKEDREAAAGG
mmetsp:Transcript_8542/g.25918  ORF Transcript_8542/g.25918 Transcript_8542/m.25918 type:complete len:204 (+) Transcript_8542:309-920(+)